MLNIAESYPTESLVSLVVHADKSTFYLSGHLGLVRNVVCAYSLVAYLCYHLL
jgi:hypothetical protein